jgi:hypothetical protein
MLNALYKACDQQWKAEFHVSANWSYKKNELMDYPNTTMWDGCKVTTVPANDKNQFVAALQRLNPPRDGADVRLVVVISRLRNSRSQNCVTFLIPSTIQDVSWKLIF